MLTSEVQFKAFTGVLCVADELQPHGAGGGVQGCFYQFVACKHPQQTSLVTAAIKDLEGERKREMGWGREHQAYTRLC